MSQAKQSPRLWSDFDGTAVEKLFLVHPRNGIKYPLKGIPGYADFLKGARDSDVEIGGVLSARPNGRSRRWATARSMSSLGLGNLFAPPAQVILAGSDQAKGLHLVAESRTTTVGMLEDRPHRVGPVLFNALMTDASAPKTAHHPIVIGVVEHARSDEYIERLMQQAQQLGERVVIAESAASIHITSESAQIGLVALPAYSMQAGQDFAARLLTPNVTSIESTTDYARRDSA